MTTDNLPEVGKGYWDLLRVREQTVDPKPLTKT
jgi:hypothetical protein